MARFVLAAMSFLVAFSAALAAMAQPVEPPQMVTFRFIFESDLPGVVVTRTSGQGAPAMLSLPLDDGRPGVMHEEPAAWPTDISFEITIPAQRAHDQLTLDLEPTKVSLAFSVRPVFDPQVIDIPVKLIDDVSERGILRILRMGDGDALEKMVLLQQAYAAWNSFSQTDRLTKDIAREWMDQIFRSATSRDRDLVTPLRVNRAARAAIAAAFSDDRERIQARFVTPEIEVEDLFWQVPGQFRLILRTGRCDIAEEAALYVITKHFDDTEAAQRTRVGEPRPQIVRMDQQLARDCTATYEAGSLVKKFDAEEALQ